jgi:hypothetical protein
MHGVSALIGLATAITVSIGGLASIGELARRRAAAPPEIAATLRNVGTILVLRAALVVVVVLFFGLAVGAGRSSFATGVVVCAGLAGAVTSMYLLMAMVRVGRAAGNVWAYVGAVLVTWSVVVESLQGWAAYRRWSLGEYAADFGWLGELTALGPSTFLLGMLALTAAIVTTVEGHRPDVKDLEPDGAVQTVFIGLLFTIVLHLPLAHHVGPSTDEPWLAALLVIAHLALPTMFVPFLRRAAARLEAAATVAVARVA